MSTKNNQKTRNFLEKIKNFSLSFPWWFKIIAYILSLVFIIVSIFFIIVRGIEFGDEKVKKWITSLLVSFLTSVLLTQPIQALLLTFVFVMLLRKYDESKDFEYDHDDKGEALNDVAHMETLGKVMLAIYHTSTSTLLN